MKKFYFLPIEIVSAFVLLALFGFSGHGQEETKGLGRVQKIMGKEVYVMCEPLREYDVVEDLGTSFTTLVAGRSTIQKQMQEVITRANNRVEKGKMKPYDAAITDDGDVIVLVKFKD